MDRETIKTYYTRIVYLAGLGASMTKNKVDDQLVVCAKKLGEATLGIDDVLDLITLVLPGSEVKL